MCDPPTDYQQSQWADCVDILQIKRHRRDLKGEVHQRLDTFKYAINIVEMVKLELTFVTLCWVILWPEVFKNHLSVIIQYS